MQHRHLKSSTMTLVATDDIISRGRLQDNGANRKVTEERKGVTIGHRGHRDAMRRRPRYIPRGNGGGRRTTLLYAFNGPAGGQGCLPAKRPGLQGSSAGSLFPTVSLLDALCPRTLNLTGNGC